MMSHLIASISRLARSLSSIFSSTSTRTMHISPMTYPYFQSNQNARGNNQFQFDRPQTVQFQPQPSWGGIDYFKAHAPDTEPTIFSQVYNRISGAGVGIHSLGVSFDEARMWHQRAYGGLGIINALTPQEIGYGSAYEAYRIWIHNSSLYEPLGGDPERQKEALIGLAVAEASRMYITSRPADVYGRVPACEASAATASLIFDQNLMGGSRGTGDGMGYAGMGYGAGMGYDAGMGTGAYGAGFRIPGMAGTGMSGGMDPYAIDYEAPYFRQRTGRNRRLSIPGSVYGASGGYSPGGGMDMGGIYGASGGYSPGGSVGMGGMGGSPNLGTGPGMGMGANSANSPMPSAYGRRSPMLGASGRRSPMPGAYGGASPINASPMNLVSPANVTAVPTYPGTTTVIHLPRKHHHRHHSKRARSAEPIVTNPGTMGGYPVGVNYPMGAGMGGYYPDSSSVGYGYPGYRGMYRY